MTKTGIDGHFPKPSRGTLWFLYGYPWVALLGAAESNALPYAVVFVGVLLALAWLAYLANTAVTALQRMGYRAAIEDFTLTQIEDAGR